jgi:hypothetical protein
MSDSIKQRQLVALIWVFLPFLAFTFLNDKDWNFSEEDKKFVKQYIIYWFIWWILLIVSSVVSVFLFFNNYDNYFIYVLSIISKILWIIVLVACILPIYFIFNDKQIWFNFSSLNVEKTSIEKNLFLYYLPVYNFYLWYTAVNEKNYRYLKESIILWTLFVLWSFLGVFFDSLLLIFIIFRVVSLYFELDFINNNRKEKIDKLFDINPEEILSYLIWPVKWIFMIVFYRFKGKTYNKSIYQEILNTKTEYKKLYLVDELKKNYNLLIQYIIFLVLFLFSLYKFYLYSGYMFGINFWFWLLVIVLFYWRYLVMFKIWKIVKIPILNEISKLLTVILFVK